MARPAIEKMYEGRLSGINYLVAVAIHKILVHIPIGPFNEKGSVFCIINNPAGKILSLVIQLYVISFVNGLFVFIVHAGEGAREGWRRCF